MTLEEGIWAAWLYDLLKPHVTKLVVCDPRKNALLKDGNRSDKIDARKLADLLRGGYLRPAYHGENGLRTLKELARSYLTISKDLTRVMNRVKALYRGWEILCGGQQVYAPRHRTEWLNKIEEAGVRRRAEFFYQQLDALRELRLVREARGNARRISRSRSRRSEGHSTSFRLGLSRLLPPNIGPQHGRRPEKLSGAAGIGQRQLLPEASVPPLDDRQQVEIAVPTISNGPNVCTGTAGNVAPCASESLLSTRLRAGLSRDFRRAYRQHFFPTAVHDVLRKHKKVLRLTFVFLHLILDSIPLRS